MQFPSGLFHMYAGVYIESARVHKHAYLVTNERERVNGLLVASDRKESTVMQMQLPNGLLRKLNALDVLVQELQYARFSQDADQMVLGIDHRNA